MTVFGITKNSARIKAYTGTKAGFLSLHLFQRYVHIVIIGNGIAGVSTARFLRKGSDARITIISAESPYHVARTALMYAYMGDLRPSDLKPYEDDFWPKNRLDLIQDTVTHVDIEAGAINLLAGGRMHYDILVLATGSRPNRFGWKGEYAHGVQGLYSMQDLTSMEVATEGIQSAAVIGGGLIGIEMAEMLRVRRIDVHLLVREQAYMDYLFSADESELIHQEIRRHGVQLHLGTELDAIETDSEDRAVAVHTTSGERLATRFVGLAVGVHPNVDLARQSGIETGKGILITNTFETSAPGVYAVGDCAEFREPLAHGRRIEQLWYSGRRQGRTLGRLLAGGTDAYSAPLFFNSAKFFDLEYHTYGDVPPHETDEVVCRQWKAGRHLIRTAAERSTGRILGVNGLGVRLRQEVAASMIRRGQDAAITPARLKTLLFEPEFFQADTTQIAEALSS